MGEGRSAIEREREEQLLFLSMISLEGRASTQRRDSDGIMIGRQMRDYRLIDWGERGIQKILSKRIQEPRRLRAFVPFCGLIGHFRFAVEFLEGSSV